MTNTEMKNTKTTKTATFMDKAKKFVKKHRVELAIGGGLLAAYVLTHKRGSANGNFQMSISTLPSPTVVNPEAIKTVGTIAETVNDISTAAAPVVETVTEAATEATKVIPEVIPEVEKVVEAVGEVM